MKAGDIAEFTIERVAFGGRGIGLLEGRVVFVPFTVDGDIVRVEIVEVRKRYAQGILKEIRLPSVHRTTPRCGDYKRCGGCCYQHITYAHQLLLKEAQVRDTCERIGKISGPPLLPVMPSPQPYHYRLKADFHVTRKQGNSPVIGLMSGASNRIVDISRCEIVDESINRRLERCRETLQSFRGRPSGDRITLWSTDRTANTAAEDGVARQPFITRTVKDHTMTVPRDGFFQANQFLIDEMVNRVTTAAALHGDETVIDAFCGSGLFSLFLAPLAGSVYGIEGNHQAIRAARQNMELNALHNLSLCEGDVARVLKDNFVKLSKAIDVLVIDPPRTGCGEGLLDQIVRLSPRRIVYVSCNPATQARDMQYLIAAGYLLESLQPLDMFPQTAHIEVIALLTR